MAWIKDFEAGIEMEDGRRGPAVSWRVSWRTLYGSDIIFFFLQRHFLQSFREWHWLGSRQRTRRWWWGRNSRERRNTFNNFVRNQFWCRNFTSQSCVSILSVSCLSYEKPSSSWWPNEDEGLLRQDSLLFRRNLKLLIATHTLHSFISPSFPVTSLCSLLSCE